MSFFFKKKKETAPEEKKESWFQRLKKGLLKSSTRISNGIFDIFSKRKLDDDSLQDLEDLLISSDIGVEITTQLTDTLSKTRFGKDVQPEEIQKTLADEITKTLSPYEKKLDPDSAPSPYVILTVGVNGAGKTTTIGKLASQYKNQGKSVMLVACDTFRAAAVGQLKIWSERTDSLFVSRKEGADASGLAFDALKQAQEENIDVVLIDTAGRLHNKKDLMASLTKIVRVIKKISPEAPHSCLLVLDATTGQNALQQVKAFKEIVNVNGLILTKLDSTSRGGVLVSICEKFKLPIHAIGVGEKIEDLQEFKANFFAKSLVGITEEEEN